PPPSALRPLPSALCLVGGKQDRDEARTIARQAGVEGVRVLAGDLTIRETASLIAQAGLFIGGDSGLAHLAVALGTPTVVLFGPSDHRKWGVEGPRNAIVRRDLACSPCFIFGYHKFCHSISCMTGITVMEVLAACRKTVDSRP
ncbi:MAG: glycosyltransferase family 9 protein, partial [bacterium]